MNTTAIVLAVARRTNCRSKEGISSSLLGVRLSQSSYQYTGLLDRWVCIKGVQGHRSRSEGPLCERAEGTKETERPAPVFVPRLAMSAVPELRLQSSPHMLQPVVHHTTVTGYVVALTRE